MPQISFATFMIICPTSFFLGLVFSLFPYDYPLLWSSEPLTDVTLTAIETHLRLLHNAPAIITRIMHIITFVGLTGLIIKLYRPTDSNMLFDGGSLVLYMVAIIVYLTNIVKGLRIVSMGTYGEGYAEVAAKTNGEGVDHGGYDESGQSVLGREDNLKVLSASNTILALVLVGVLVLQIGQWYAERAEEKERLEIAAKEKDGVKDKKTSKKKD